MGRPSLPGALLATGRRCVWSGEGTDPIGAFGLGRVQTRSARIETGDTDRQTQTRWCRFPGTTRPCRCRLTCNTAGERARLEVRVGPSRRHVVKRGGRWHRPARKGSEQKPMKRPALVVLFHLHETKYTWPCMVVCVYALDVDELFRPDHGSVQNVQIYICISWDNTTRYSKKKSNRCIIFDTLWNPSCL